MRVMEREGDDGGGEMMGEGDMEGGSRGSQDDTPPKKKGPKSGQPQGPTPAQAVPSSVR